MDLLRKVGTSFSHETINKGFVNRSDSWRHIIDKLVPLWQPFLSFKSFKIMLDSKFTFE